MKSNVIVVTCVLVALFAAALPALTHARVFIAFAAGLAAGWVLKGKSDTIVEEDE